MKLSWEGNVTVMDCGKKREGLPIKVFSKQGVLDNMGKCIVFLHVKKGGKGMPRASLNKMKREGEKVPGWRKNKLFSRVGKKKGGGDHHT